MPGSVLDQIRAQRSGQPPPMLAPQPPTLPPAASAPPLQSVAPATPPASTQPDQSSPQRPGGVLAAIRARRGSPPPMTAAAPAEPFRALGPGDRPQTREQAIRRVALHRQARPPETRIEPGLGAFIGAVGSGGAEQLWNMARTGATLSPAIGTLAPQMAAATPWLQREYFEPSAEASPTGAALGALAGQVPAYTLSGGAASAATAGMGVVPRLLAQAGGDVLASQAVLPPEAPLRERATQAVMAPAMGIAARVPGEVLAGIRAARGAPAPASAASASPMASPEMPARPINLEAQTADLPAFEPGTTEPSMGGGRVSPAQAEAVGQRAMNRRAADQIDGLAALPPDEAAQFKARLRVEGSTPQARQQILADAHDANAAWERVGGSQEVAPQPERHYTPEEQAAGDAALEAAGYSGPERRATVRPEPSPQAQAMSARLPDEAAIPGNLGPQGEMGGRTLVNEPGGSTRAEQSPAPGGRAEAPAPRTLTPEEQAFRMSAKLAPDRRALFPRASEVPPSVRDATLDTAIEGVSRQQRAAQPDVYNTQPLRPGEAQTSARAPGPYDTQPVPRQPPARSGELAPAGAGRGGLGPPSRGGPPTRRLFEPDDVSHPPGPPGPPSPAVNEFFGRTATAPSKATTLLPRVINQLKETFITSHKLRGEHVVYDPRLGEVGASTSFADARNRIRLLADVGRHASTKTIEALKPVVEGLNHEQLDILRRKVFIEDLLETSRRGEATPLTAADLAAEKARLDPIVAADPLLARAFRRDQELWQAAGADLVKRGKLAPENLRAHYVHHEVMDYISQKGAGLGKPYSLRNVSRRYLRRRLGSSKDIYTNYLDVRYRSLAKHVRDNMIDDAVTEIANRYGVPGADAERLGYVPFSAEELWQVAGKTSHDQAVMRMVTDISRDLDPALARTMLEGAEQRLLKRKVYIHPDLAATLTHLRDIYQEPGILAKATGHWKQAMLNKNPPRYNFNNMIGDAERGWNALPEMFRDGGRERMGRVLRDLKAASRGEFSSDYRLAQQHSVVDSGEIYHEIGAIKEAEAFKHLDPNDRGSWHHPLTYISAKLRDASTTRENLLRLQAFYTNLDRMRAGKPLAAGVSDIRGLSDPVAAAAKVSREALGDYGDFTPREVKWRRGILPFYSWLKINTTFWPTLFARRGAGAGAKAAARIAPRAALKSGLAIAKATAIYAAASAFNNTVQQEQEESLPEDVRRKFHVNTGLHDAKDRWVTITEPTAMSDFMDGIGVEGVTTDVAELLRGQLSARDFAGGMAGRTAAPLRKVASRVTPAITGPVEAVTGRRFYPDPLNPSPSAEHNPLTRLASGMGFGEFTSPQQTLDTYKRSLGELGAIGIRRYDAGLSALRNTEERVRAFRSAKGYIDDAPSEGPLTAVNRALLYALADKNYTRAAAILRKTSPKAFGAYLGARDPIVRIPVKFRKEFAATLSAHDREQIARAKAFLGATGGSLRQAVAPAPR